VKVTMRADQECTSVQVGRELLKDADGQMLQDLVPSAANLALDQSRSLASGRLGPLAGGPAGWASQARKFYRGEIPREADPR
jgi:DNA-binding protein YbaB